MSLPKLYLTTTTTATTTAPPPPPVLTATAAATTSLLLLLLFVLTATPTRSQASMVYDSQCDFEKYALTGGCYSQANFVCDPDSQRCRCHPNMPVLIEQRFCLRRAKVNEICQYNEQCDNDGGYYCYYGDTHKMVNGSAGHHSQNDPSTTNLRGYNKSEQPRCRHFASKTRYKQPQYKQHYQLYHQQQQQQHLPPQQQPPSSFPTSPQTQQQTKLHSSPRNLPRLVWLLLLVSLLGLVILLLIKSQQTRINRSFQQQADDRLSINSELDVPPPYEVAIRMKI